jgi:hypothetical protein
MFTSVLVCCVVSFDYINHSKLPSVSLDGIYGEMSKLNVFKLNFYTLGSDMIIATHGDFI